MISLNQEMLDHRDVLILGIVSARMLGIRGSTAPIFVILDSHIEVVSGWAQPLSERIMNDRRKVLMPQIDAIDPETFIPGTGGIGCTLGKDDE